VRVATAFWQGVYATAIAFEQGLGARWPVRLISPWALFGLFQCFQRQPLPLPRVLLFCQAAAERFIPLRYGPQKISHASAAVVGITAGTLVGLFLGDALLVPVTEVGSMAFRLRMVRLAYRLGRGEARCQCGS